MGTVEGAFKPIPRSLTQEMVEIATNTLEPEIGITRILSLGPQIMLNGILSKDPTRSGFTVVDHIIEQFGNGWGIREWEDGTYVQTGAKLAGKHYKEFYPFIKRHF